MSAPLWLRFSPDQMACVAAGVYFAGSLLVTKFAVEFVHHRSTVERSAPGGAAPSGAGRWAAEPGGHLSVDTGRVVDNPPAGSPTPR